MRKIFNVTCLRGGGDQGCPFLAPADAHSTTYTTHITTRARRITRENIAAIRPVRPVSSPAA